MQENFKLEIISPEKIIFSDNVDMVTLPSYEGDMSILKNHIPIITFLRPGIIKIQKNGNNLANFFAEDGTIEFYDNGLTILSASAENVKNLSREFVDKLSQEAQKKLDTKDVTDHDRYILNHKIEVLKGIRT